MAIRGNYQANVPTYRDSATYETTGRLSSVVLYDDFLNPSLVVPAAGSLESGVLWAKKIVGAAPPTVAGVANDTNGTVACTLTATSEKQDAELYAADQLCLSMLQGLVFESRFQLSVLPTGAAQATVGLTSAWADGHDAITYSAFVTARASGLLKCDTDDNVTDNDVSSGVTLVNTDWCIVRIDATTATDIKFYINGVAVATSTTFGWAASAANSKVQPFIGMYKASGTGVGTLTVDYVRIWQNRA